MSTYSIRRTEGILGSLAGFAALALAACSEPPEKAYETSTQDQSGGDLIVNDARSKGVAVDIPETEMTPVPNPSSAADPETGMMERSQ